MMERKILLGVMIGAVILLFSNKSSAQEVENDFQTRLSASLEFEPINKLKLEVSPEFRFDEDYYLDKYFTEVNASYKTFDFLTLGVGYRFIANTRKSEDTEYFHRYSLSSTFKKKLGRFKPSFRILYANYSDEDDNNKLLRFKAKIKYSISGSRITPFVATEAFRPIDNNDFYKMRYSAGISYKLFKYNHLQVGYKLDYYLNEYKNKHILTIGYKIKF